jgi:hypothetical protein
MVLTKQGSNNETTMNSYQPHCIQQKPELRTTAVTDGQENIL